MKIKFLAITFAVIFAYFSNVNLTFASNEQWVCSEPSEACKKACEAYKNGTISDVKTENKIDNEGKTEKTLSSPNSAILMECLVPTKTK